MLAGDGDAVLQPKHTKGVKGETGETRNNLGLENMM